MNILDLIFPKRCVGCGKGGRYFCEICAGKILLFKEPICPVCFGRAIDGATHPRCQTRYSLDGLTAFFHYRGVVQKAIKRLKYRFVTDLAEEFIDLLPSSFFKSNIWYPSSILIPIPLHSFRLRFRGFNQAEILGKIIAGKLDIPLRTDLLLRVKKTLPQVEMKERKKRLKNMEDVFTVNNWAMKQLNKAAILLFDDVTTTGATLRSAANVLKRRGIKKVWGITMAHG